MSVIIKCPNCQEKRLSKRDDHFREVAEGIYQGDRGYYCHACCLDISAVATFFPIQTAPRNTPIMVVTIPLVEGESLVEEIKVIKRQKDLEGFDYWAPIVTAEGIIKALR